MAQGIRPLFGAQGSFITRLFVYHQMDAQRSTLLNCQVIGDHAHDAEDDGVQNIATRNEPIGGYSSWS